MKYFTPELLAQFASTDDQVADRANAAWEVALEQYTTHLVEIRPLLPQAITDYLDEYQFHDAQVKTLARSGRTFSIVLHPESTEDSALRLVYMTVSQGKVTRHQRSDRLAALEWLYDEISVVNGDDDKDTFFRHNILFTQGIEIELVFKELKVVSAETAADAAETDPMKAIDKLQREWAA